MITGLDPLNEEDWSGVGVFGSDMIDENRGFGAAKCWDWDLELLV